MDETSSQVGKTVLHKTPESEHRKLLEAVPKQIMHTVKSMLTHQPILTQHWTKNTTD